MYALKSEASTGPRRILAASQSQDSSDLMVGLSCGSSGIDDPNVAPFPRDESQQTTWKAINVRISA